MRKIKINTLNWSLSDEATGETIYRENFNREINLRDCVQGRERWVSGRLFTEYDFCRECLNLSNFVIVASPEVDPLAEFSEQLREAEKHLEDLRANLNNFKKLIENLGK
jgi:hypothetical protein